MGSLNIYSNADVLKALMITVVIEIGIRCRTGWSKGRMDLVFEPVARIFFPHGMLDFTCLLVVFKSK